MTEDISPYGILRKLLEFGGSLSLRELSAALAGKCDDPDEFLGRVETMLLDYLGQCGDIGEEPVVNVNELTDEVTSSTFFDIDYTISDIKSSVEASNRAWISYYLRSMSWERFEDFCRELLEGMGVSDAELTSRGSDEGIDFTGSYFNPQYMEMVYPIIGQAKHYQANNSVGVEPVRSMIAKLSIHSSAAVQGFLMTTSDFTLDAISEAQKSPKKLHLWNMGNLIDQVVELRFGFYFPECDIFVLDASHWDRYLEE
jgi:hypothetical protein